MKAAWEAWGADSNLFHLGAAKESHDPDVIAATMAKSGVVLKRPVGSNGAFSEHADLPTNLGDNDKPTKTTSKPHSQKPKKGASRPVNKAAERKAALEYEREQKLRDRARAREEAARHKERLLRQQAIDNAQTAMDAAEREHAKQAGAIQAEADAIEKRAQAELGRWKKREAPAECGDETCSRELKNGISCLDHRWHEGGSRDGRPTPHFISIQLECCGRFQGRKFTRFSSQNGAR